MIKVILNLLKLTIKIVIKNMELQNQLLNKIDQVKQLLNNKEYFNARLVVDNIKHIYIINKITDAVLVRELQMIEKLVKQYK